MTSKRGEGCPLCGASTAGGARACRDLFDQVCALEYGDPAYGAVHLLTVDSYALQHHEDHGPRSSPWHLLRLCTLFEHGASASIGLGGPRSLQTALGAGLRLPAISPPDDRGSLPIVDVHGSADAEEHAERVRRWAESEWAAWGVHHDWARGLLTRL